MQLVLIHQNLDLANLNSDAEKLDINKLQNVPNSLINS